MEDHLREVVSEGLSTLQEHIEAEFNAEAAVLATDLLTQMTFFWNELTVWITSTQNKLVERGAGSPKECWQLVSASLGKIGQNGDDSFRFWGTLQAYRIAKELREAKFQGHPEVSVVLHEHLVDNAVPKSAFLALQEEVRTLKKVAATAEAAANKAQATATNALKKAEKK